MKQIGRTLADPFDGFLAGTRCIILNRNPRYTGELRGLFKQAGVNVIRLSARSPNLNAYAEKFVRTIKEFVEYFHHERNHQELGNRLSDPLTEGEKLTEMLKVVYGLAACFDTIIEMPLNEAAVSDNIK